jgi:hypothetical protein
LQVSNGSLMTNDNFTYMTVMIAGRDFNISTILTIDDWGIIRLIGTYQLPDFRNQESLEFTVSTFQSSNNYIYPASKLEVTFMTQFGPVTNQNNWEFSTLLGQFDIVQINNPGLTISYSYSAFKLNNSLIYDFPGSTFPATIFPNITFPPRCLEPRLYIDFKTPYVLVLDPFWPMASVYEQGRYKIAEVSFGSVYQAQAWQQDRRLQFRSQHSACPPYSFEHKGSCVTVCPSPYYYEMRGALGYCVLTCEGYTPKNDTTRICSCYTDYEAPSLTSNTVSACPSDAVSYPYGCYCSANNTFFDRTLTFSCVATCPQGTFGSNGICMECPARCITCQLDKLYRGYLECKACESGFKIVNGQCYAVCSPGMGNSLVNGVCQPCSDPNCRDCSTNVGVCTKCSILYAVSNGACLRTC